MRELYTHEVAGDNSPQVEINVMDEPGFGGAHHKYLVKAGNSSGSYAASIDFQNGPIKEVGLNGLSAESLLAIAIDRLECFQKGPFACKARLAGLLYAKLSLEEMQSRTRDRIARGVEGKSIA